MGLQSSNPLPDGRGPDKSGDSEEQSSSRSQSKKRRADSDEDEKKESTKPTKPANTSPSNPTRSESRKREKKMGGEEAPEDTGIEEKRGRGRPVGSKNKPKKDDSSNHTPKADTPSTSAVKKSSWRVRDEVAEEVMDVEKNEEDEEENQEEKVKKKKGRPLGSKNKTPKASPSSTTSQRSSRRLKNGEVAEAMEVEEEEEEGEEEQDEEKKMQEEPKPRGRPVGSKNKPKDPNSCTPKRSSTRLKGDLREEGKELEDDKDEEDNEVDEGEGDEAQEDLLPEKRERKKKQHPVDEGYDEEKNRREKKQRGQGESTGSTADDNEPKSESDAQMQPQGGGEPSNRSSSVANIGKKATTLAAPGAEAPAETPKRPGRPSSKSLPNSTPEKQAKIEETAKKEKQRDQGQSSGSTVDNNEGKSVTDAQMQPQGGDAPSDRSFRVSNSGKKLTTPAAPVAEAPAEIPKRPGRPSNKPPPSCTPAIQAKIEEPVKSSKSIQGKSESDAQIQLQRPGRPSSKPASNSTPAIQMKTEETAKKEKQRDQGESSGSTVDSDEGKAESDAQMQLQGGDAPSDRNSRVAHSEKKRTTPAETPKRRGRPSSKPPPNSTPVIQAKREESAKKEKQPEDVKERYSRVDGQDLTPSTSRVQHHTQSGTKINKKDVSDTSHSTVNAGSATEESLSNKGPPNKPGKKKKIDESPQDGEPPAKRPRGRPRKDAQTAVNGDKSNAEMSDTDEKEPPHPQGRKKKEVKSREDDPRTAEDETDNETKKNQTLQDSVLPHTLPKKPGRKKEETVMSPASVDVGDSATESQRRSSRMNGVSNDDDEKEMEKQKPTRRSQSAIQISHGEEDKDDNGETRRSARKGVADSVEEKEEEKNKGIVEKEKEKPKEGGPAIQTPPEKRGRGRPRKSESQPPLKSSPISTTVVSSTSAIEKKSDDPEKTAPKENPAPLSPDPPAKNQKKAEDQEKTEPRQNTAPTSPDAPSKKQTAGTSADPALESEADESDDDVEMQPASSTPSIMKEVKTIEGPSSTGDEAESASHKSGHPMEGVPTEKPATTPSDTPAKEKEVRLTDTKMKRIDNGLIDGEAMEGAAEAVIELAFHRSPDKKENNDDQESNGRDGTEETGEASIAPSRSSQRTKETQKEKEDAIVEAHPSAGEKKGVEDLLSSDNEDGKEANEPQIPPDPALPPKESDDTKKAERTDKSIPSPPDISTKEQEITPRQPRDKNEKVEDEASSRGETFEGNEGEADAKATPRSFSRQMKEEAKAGEDAVVEGHQSDRKKKKVNYGEVDLLSSDNEDGQKEPESQSLQDSAFPQEKSDDSKKAAPTEKTISPDSPEKEQEIASPRLTDKKEKSDHHESIDGGAKEGNDEDGEANTTLRRSSRRANETSNKEDDAVIKTRWSARDKKKVNYGKEDLLSSDNEERKEANEPHVPQNSTLPQATPKKRGRKKKGETVTSPASADEGEPIAKTRRTVGPNENEEQSNDGIVEDQKSGETPDGEEEENGRDDDQISNYSDEEGRAFWNALKTSDEHDDEQRRERNRNREWNENDEEDDGDGIPSEAEDEEMTEYELSDSHEDEEEEEEDEGGGAVERKRDRIEGGEDTEEDEDEEEEEDEAEDEKVEEEESEEEEVDEEDDDEDDWDVDWDVEFGEQAQELETYELFQESLPRDWTDSTEDFHKSFRKWFKRCKKGKNTKDLYFPRDHGYFKPVHIFIFEGRYRILREGPEYYHYRARGIRVARHRKFSNIRDVDGVFGHFYPIFTKEDERREKEEGDSEGVTYYRDVHRQYLEFCESERTKKEERRKKSQTKRMDDQREIDEKEGEKEEKVEKKEEKKEEERREDDGKEVEEAEKRKLEFTEREKKERDDDHNSGRHAGDQVENGLQEVSQGKGDEQLELEEKGEVYDRKGIDGVEMGEKEEIGMEGTEKEEAQMNRMDEKLELEAEEDEKEEEDRGDLEGKGKRRMEIGEGEENEKEDELMKELDYAEPSAPVVNVIQDRVNASSAVDVGENEPVAVAVAPVAPVALVANVRQDRVDTGKAAGMRSNILTGFLSSQNVIYGYYSRRQICNSRRTTDPSMVKAVFCTAKYGLQAIDYSTVQEYVMDMQKIIKPPFRKRCVAFNMHRSFLPNEHVNPTQPPKAVLTGTSINFFDRLYAQRDRYNCDAAKIRTTIVSTIWDLLRDKAALNSVKEQIYSERGVPAEYKFSVGTVADYKMNGRVALVHDAQFMRYVQSVWQRDGLLRVEMEQARSLGEEKRKRLEERKNRGMCAVSSPKAEKEENKNGNVMDGDDTGHEQMELEEKRKEKEQGRIDKSLVPFTYKQAVKHSLLEHVDKKIFELGLHRQVTKWSEFVRLQHNIDTSETQRQLAFFHIDKCIRQSVFLGLPPHEIDPLKDPHSESENVVHMGSGIPYHNTITVSRLQHPLITGHRTAMVDMFAEVSKSPKKIAPYFCILLKVNQGDWEYAFPLPVNEKLLASHPTTLDLRYDVAHRIPPNCDIRVLVRVIFSGDKSLRDKRGRISRDKEQSDEYRRTRREEEIDFDKEDMSEMSTYFGWFHLCTTSNVKGARPEWSYGVKNIVLIHEKDISDDEPMVFNADKQSHVPSIDEVQALASRAHGNPFLEMELFNEDKRTREYGTKKCRLYSGTGTECKHLSGLPAPKKKDEDSGDDGKGDDKKKRRKKNDDEEEKKGDEEDETKEEGKEEENGEPNEETNEEAMEEDATSDNEGDNEEAQKDRSLLPVFDFVRGFSGHRIAPFENIEVLLCNVNKGDSVKEDLEEVIGCTLESAKADQLDSIGKLQSLKFPSVIYYRIPKEKEEKPLMLQNAVTKTSTMRRMMVQLSRRRTQKFMEDVKFARKKEQCNEAKKRFRYKLRHSKVTKGLLNIEAKNKLLKNLWPSLVNSDAKSKYVLRTRDVTLYRPRYRVSIKHNKTEVSDAMDMGDDFIGEPPMKKARLEDRSVQETAKDIELVNELGYKMIEMDYNGKKVTVAAWRPEFGLYRDKSKKMECINERVGCCSKDIDFSIAPVMYGRIIQEQEKETRRRIILEQQGITIPKKKYKRLIHVPKKPSNRIAREATIETMPDGFFRWHEEIEFQLQQTFEIPTVHLREVRLRIVYYKQYMLDLTTKEREEFIDQWRMRGVDVETWCYDPFPAEQHYMYVRKLKEAHRRGYINYNEICKRWRAVRARTPKEKHMFDTRLGADNTTMRCDPENPSFQLKYQLKKWTTPNKCFLCKTSCYDMYSLLMHYNLVHIRLNFKLLPNIQKEIGFDKVLKDAIVIDVCLDIHADTTRELLTHEARMDKPPATITANDYRRPLQPVKLDSKTGDPLYITTHLESALLREISVRSMVNFTKILPTPSSERSLQADRVCDIDYRDLVVFDHLARKPGDITIPRFTGLQAEYSKTLPRVINEDYSIIERTYYILMRFFLASLDLHRSIPSHYNRMRFFLRCNLHILCASPLNSSISLRLFMRDLDKLVAKNAMTIDDRKDLIRRYQHALSFPQLNGDVDSYNPFTDKKSPLREQLISYICERNIGKWKRNQPTQTELLAAMNEALISKHNFKIGYHARSELEAIYGSNEVWMIQEWMFAPKLLFQFVCWKKNDDLKEGKQHCINHILAPPLETITPELGERAYSHHYFLIRMKRREEDRTIRQKEFNRAKKAHYHLHQALAEISCRPRTILAANLQ